jgi:hypothetical protein
MIHSKIRICHSDRKTVPVSVYGRKIAEKSKLISPEAKAAETESVLARLMRGGRHESQCLL